MNIFVAHSQKDLPLAAELQQSLGARGHRVNYAGSASVSAESLDNISDSIRSADAVIVLLSDPRPNLLYELGVAAGSSRPLVVAARNVQDLPADAGSIPYVSLGGDVFKDAQEISYRVEALQLSPHSTESISGDVLEIHNLLDVIPSSRETISGPAFEMLLEGLLRTIGIEVESVPAHAKDGGFDFVLHSPHPDEGPVLVQTKLLPAQKRIGIDTITRLNIAMTAASAPLGLVISTAPYSAAALSFAAANHVITKSLAQLLEARGWDDLIESGDRIEVRTSLPSENITEGAHNVAIEAILTAGGSRAEAEAIASSVTLYVEAFWNDRLETLARHPEEWSRHIQRVAMRSWLSKLQNQELNIAKRALIALRVRDLLDDVPEADRWLFESLYLQGLSIHETSLVLGISRDEAVSRLRATWDGLRTRFNEQEITEIAHNLVVTGQSDPFG